MEIQETLLNIMLHFTPFGYLLCAGLLFMRRNCGDRARILLAISFVVWGIFMLGSVIHHYQDTSEYVPEVFSMISLNITLFVFFIMLFYPIEVIEPERLNTKGFIILFSPWILLNVILLATKPEFRLFTSFGEIFQYIGEYNVWLRLAVVIIMLPLACIILYIPYRYKKSRVTLMWIRLFVLGLSGSTLLYIVWVFTGNDTIRLIMQIYCLLFCIIMTYQEMFLHLPLPSRNTNLHSSPISTIESQILATTASSGTSAWNKLLKHIVKDALWRNPDLTIVELASILGTNRTTLSSLIREGGYDGFYAFINTCRIKEFIHIIETQEINSIHETFFNVGFRSKTTAIRYFRQVTGTTPSEYLQKTLLSRQ